MAAVRATIETLDEEGLSRAQAETATWALLSWLGDTERLNDQSLGDATVRLSLLLRERGLSRWTVDFFCEIAPECLDYLSDGTGLEKGVLEKYLATRQLESRVAVMKMLSVAGLRHHNSDAVSLLMNAKALPPVR